MLLVKVICDPHIYKSAEEAFEACGVETTLCGIFPAGMNEWNG
jgi:hypothetical protein